MSDVSLVDFIGVKGKFAVWLPHTAGRYQSKSFRKTNCPIVERLITAMMFHGRNNGKKQMAQKIVKASDRRDNGDGDDDDDKPATVRIGTLDDLADAVRAFVALFSACSTPARSSTW